MLLPGAFVGCAGAGHCDLKQPKVSLPRLSFGAGSGWDGITEPLDGCSVLRSVVAARAQKGTFISSLASQLAAALHQAFAPAPVHAAASAERLTVT